jgi:hypothetical protein
MNKNFLSKKSWHPSTIKNIEKVWIAEQNHKDELKKIETLKKELAEQKKFKGLDKAYREQQGLAKRERMEWMYVLKRQDDEEEVPEPTVPAPPPPPQLPPMGPEIPPPQVEQPKKNSEFDLDDCLKLLKKELKKDKKKKRDKKSKKEKEKSWTSSETKHAAKWETDADKKRKFSKPEDEPTASIVKEDDSKRDSKQPKRDE